ncbi:MAG: phosphopantothenoylcysteine decarboxylase [Phycisphaerales bacterium]|nr:phosphopantothenoylcysteine decarboxylase [Phycisphaerales bacterium]
MNQRPTPKLLITAGPTQEPIDAVRYLGNRSSGRLGIALAEAAKNRGWDVLLLLGPTTTPPPSPDTHLRVLRFRTTADLEGLLAEHAPSSEILVMAAAVADYRPKGGGSTAGKLPRSSAGLTLELEATPDLLAGCTARRRPGQFFVGFALEPQDRLLDSARAKLTRKKVDMVVANPLETMDASTIDAVLVLPSKPEIRTPGAMDKAAFAPWLLDRIEAAVSQG